MHSVRSNEGQFFKDWAVINSSNSDSRNSHRLPTRKAGISPACAMRDSFPELMRKKEAASFIERVRGAVTVRPPAKPCPALEDCT